MDAQCTTATTHGLLLVQPKLLVGFATPLVDKRVARHTVDQLHVVQLAVVLVLQPLAWSQCSAVGANVEHRSVRVCLRMRVATYRLRHANAVGAAARTFFLLGFGGLKNYAELGNLLRNSLLHHLVPVETPTAAR